MASFPSLKLNFSSCTTFLLFVFHVLLSPCCVILLISITYVHIFLRFRPCSSFTFHLFSLPSLIHWFYFFPSLFLCSFYILSILTPFCGPTSHLSSNSSFFIFFFLSSKLLFPSPRDSRASAASLVLILLESSWAYLRAERDWRLYKGEAFKGNEAKSSRCTADINIHECHLGLVEALHFVENLFTAGC